MEGTLAPDLIKERYQATLLMLKAGAKVIATTRFPKDSTLRFSKEPDFRDWGHRLQIYGLDLRHTPSVELFCDYIQDTYQRLDILINNAAQTVRRPPGYCGRGCPDLRSFFPRHPLRQTLVRKISKGLFPH